MTRKSNTFGHEDFDPSRVRERPRAHCPVRGCTARLQDVQYGRGTAPWCPEHQIRLHQDTFVYWHLDRGGDDARIRNFAFERDLAMDVALRKGMKAEGHRLGHEKSEDALSWNVFVALAAARRLRKAGKFLTGHSFSREPELYLWGRRIDVHDGPSGIEYSPLTELHGRLERGIAPFHTEPDIMLVVEGERVVCIEAKFCSANPLEHPEHVGEGEKPKDRAGLVARYLGDKTCERTRNSINVDRLGTGFRSQLFRNVVFASEMMEGWHVVNLVSRTQLHNPVNRHYSSADPTQEIQAYLREDLQDRFTYRTWEDFHTDVIRDDLDLSGLSRYMRSKSAGFLPAFHLT